MPGMADSDIATAAVRRSNQQYYEQISHRETLDCGYAYNNAEYAHLPECNFLGEVSFRLAGPDAFETVEAFYREKGLTCACWVPAADQPPEQVAEMLAPHGFARRESIAMLHDGSRPPAAADESLRVIGARAMRRAYTRICTERFADYQSPTDELVAAQLERLNDPQYDAFVAMLADEPAGTITVHQVGDIGRIRDIFVVPALRRRGVGLALVAFALATAARWSLRTICTAISVENTIGRTLLTRVGFMEGATIVSFCRPNTGEIPQ